MADTMLAVVKPDAAPGAEIRQVKIPEFGLSDVLVKVDVASVCGTDLHIYNWDPWAQNRIHPPLIPGHEFCGHVAAVGKEVTTVKEGDFVSAEMHVACGKCLQCRTGRSAHLPAREDHRRGREWRVRRVRGDSRIEYMEAGSVDPEGVRVDSRPAGERRAHRAWRAILRRRQWRSLGPGPSGLFSIAVARACGATQIFAIETNKYRRAIAQQMKADFVIDPTVEDPKQIVMDATEGIGVDVVLEMAGHPSAIRTGFDILRRGGRISLLGIPSRPISLDFADDIIFKGATIQGINGRKMYQTWYQMTALLKAGKLDLHPVITDRLAMKDFNKGMERLKTGEASKILLYPNGSK